VIPLLPSSDARRFDPSSRAPTSPAAIESLEARYRDRISSLPILLHLSFERGLSVDRPIKVFCSHRSLDKLRVLEIARRLRDEGIDAWVDAWEIQAGQSLVARINEGLADCEIGLIFFSKVTLESAWVGAEIDALTHFLIENQKRVFPVMLDPEAPVPPLLVDLLRLPAEPVEGLVAAIYGDSPKPPLGRRRQASAERIFRVLLTERSEWEIEVAAWVDGKPAAGPEGVELGRDFAFSYFDFLTGRRPYGRPTAPATPGSGLEPALARLGEAVGAAIFPGPVGARLEALLLEARGSGAPVSLEIETRSPRLLSIPFEAARLPNGAVLSLLPEVRMARRYALLHPPSATSALPGPLSMLVAVGAPDEGKTRNSVLDLEAELGAILQAVEDAHRRGDVFVRLLEVGHPSQIEEALSERRYHVLHLTGHGGKGSIELETEDGEPCPTTAAELAAAIRRSGNPVPLVFLGCCHSGTGSSETASLAQGLLEQGVPRVLAMQTQVSDSYATRLAAVFYERLCRVPLASQALAAARCEVEEERRKQAAAAGPRADPEFATPALFLAGPDAPLFDPRLPREEPARLRRIPAGGAVPRLRMDELIGRRKELREVLWVLRDDPKATARWGRRAGVQLLGIGGVGKSALAGRVLERLEEDGWRIVAVERRFSLGDLARQAAVTLAGDPDAALREIAERLRAPELPDAERLGRLQALLANFSVLFVLDNFESQLSAGGQGFLDPTLAGILAELYRAAGRGKVLVTCRYPVPGAEAYLAPFHLGPLSAAEARKLLYRLPRLARQEPQLAQRILRQVGGHPRVLEYLDALMNEGSGRLPAVTAKLEECAERAGVDVEDLGGGVDEALRDAFWVGAQDIFLDELLEIVEKQGDREVLFQLAAFPVPVTRSELAFALAEGTEPEDSDLKTLRRTLKRLGQLSLATPIEEDFVWIHRWTAEALETRAEEEDVQEARRRAGEALVWRLRNRTHLLEDAKEAARLLLRAGAWDRAVEESWGVLSFLRNYGQRVDLVAFTEEILQGLPEDSEAYPGFLRESADALSILGAGTPAMERYQRALDLSQRLASAEPQRADYQRDLSVSFERMGDLLVSLGEGEEARRFYQDALNLRQRLASAEPQRADYQRDLSVSFNKMGDLLVSLGEGEEARRFYQDALNLSQRLASAEPQRADYQRDLAVSFHRMMTVDPANAAEHSRSAGSVLRGLKDRGALLPPDEPWLRSMEALPAAPGESEKPPAEGHG
jgi:tetratricopeptide (TPR) repeat protein